MIMAKWKCEICGSGFDNFHSQGFDNKIYCPLCYFKKLSADLQVENYKLNDKAEKQRKEYQETYKDVREEIKDLKSKNQDLQQRIDKAMEYINSNPNVFYDENLIDVETLLKNEYTDEYVGDIKFISKLLSILKGKDVK